MATRREPNGPSERTIKRLFALSGNQCAFPRCTTALIQGETVVGQVCHIKAAKPGGPRYHDRQTNAERHAFANLILMCGTDHTVIDDDEEAYTVERLAKLKAEREKGAAPIDATFAQHAAQLLINQTITSTNQSGGITAHTVNADTINLHPPSILALGASAPDWLTHELFYYLRPNISPNSTSTLWDEVGSDVLDKLSSGQLHAWGREVVRGATTTFLSLTPIDRAYWRAARFNYVFLLDDHERDVHVTQHLPSNLPNYADLRINREDAVRLWPHPLHGNWNVQAITLTARYFNHRPDQVPVECKMVTLFDAHVETKCDASGAQQYQQLVAPAYILATGVDSAFIRSLTWKPQQLSFIDLATNTEHEYFLTGTVDASAQNGKAKFFLDPQTAIAPQPISPDSFERATEFFAGRMNYIYAEIAAPAGLRRGPKLILQVLPTSAFDNGRTIDHAAPQWLAHHFMPDEYQNYEGRPRQDGWVWYQPPQPMPGLQNPVSWWHSRLDWNGCVEIVETLEEVDGEERVEVIRGYPLERHVVKTLDGVSEGYRQLNIRSPVILRVELLGVLGTRLTKSGAGFSKGFDRPVVVTEALGLTQMTKPLGRALRPILDSLWRAAGWADGSPSYGRGDWDGYDNPYPYQ